jgi:endonuclease III
VTLAQAITGLRAHYGAPRRPPTKDPFALVLLENIAYLATADRRREAFTQLKRTVGLKPADIMKADRKTLEAVTAHGILKEQFAKKLRECAVIAMKEFDGRVDDVVKLPAAQAKRALRKFPGIGEPGAEKILLFSGRQPFLGPESNGLRVLTRLGFVAEQKSYARTYALAKDAARGLAPDTTTLQEAHLLLQQHGQTLCTRNAPGCGICPLKRDCAYGRTS